MKRTGHERRAAPPGPRDRRDPATREAAERVLAGEPVPTPPATRGGSVLERHLDVIGLEPDKAVAARAGVTPGAVARYRLRHGIPAPSRAAASDPAVVVSVPEVLPAPPPPLGEAASNGDDGVHGWQVQIDQQAYIVVADDIVTAAQAAVAAGRGAVVRVELLGRALQA